MVFIATTHENEAGYFYWLQLGIPLIFWGSLIQLSQSYCVSVDGHFTFNSSNKDRFSTLVKVE